MRQRKKLFNSILSFILILTMVAGNLTVAKAENNLFTPELLTSTDENGVEFTKTAYWVDAAGNPVEYASQALKDEKGNPIAEVKLRVNGTNLDLEDSVIHEGAADVVIVLDTSNSMQWDGICYQNGEEKRTFSYNTTAAVYEIKKNSKSTWTEVTEDAYNNYTDNLADSNYVFSKRRSGSAYEIKKTATSNWTKVSKSVYNSSVTDINISNYVFAKQTYTKTVTKNVNTTVDEFFNSSDYAGARYGTTGMNFTDSRIYYAKNKLFDFTQTLLNDSENVDVAFVAFHNSVSAAIGFDQYTDYNDLRSKITSLKTDGGTNPAPALEKAKALLEAKGGDAEKVVVYIGDGATSNSSYQTNAIAKAKELKKAGITIYSIGYCIEDGTSTDSSAKAFIKALASGDDYFMSASTSDNDTSVDLGIILERIQKIITKEAGEASVVDAIPNYFEVLPGNDVTSNMLEENGTYTELTWKVNSLVQNNVFTYRMAFDKSYINQLDSNIDSHTLIYKEGTATALLSYSLIQKTNGEQTDAIEYKTGLGNLKLKVDTYTYTIHYMVDDVENSTIKLDHIKALKNDRIVIYNKADAINLGTQDTNYKIYIDSGSIALSDASEANGIASFILSNDSEITVNYKTKYTISFETSHGTAPESISVKMGNSYTLDNSVNITTEDFVLEGWRLKDSSDDAKYAEGSEVGGGTEDITLVAVWIPIFGVIYDSNGGTPSDISDNADYRVGDNVTVTEVEPTRDDDIFNGWEYNGVLYHSGDFVTMPENGITFTADWTTRYEVSFYLDGNLLDQFTQHVEDASQITDPLSEIALNLDSSKEIISTWTVPTSINGDIQLYAETTTKVFTATYWYGDVNTGILIDSQIVEYGAAVTPVVGVVTGSAITTGPAIVFMKNNEIIQTVECTDAVGVDFAGFQVAPEHANVEKVTSNLDFYSSATKYYSITYLVDGKEVQCFTPIQEGTVLTEEYNFNYLVPEGKTFSGWSQKLPEKLTGNLVISGTTTDKIYTVTFTDAQGTIIESNVLWGTNLTVPAPRAKADETGNKEDGSAYWYKFTPEQWKPATAEAAYTINDLSSVQQNMDFVVKYQKNEVYTKYYVLKRGLAQPDELSHYPIPNYSKGVIGNLKVFKEIANDDSAVQNNLVNVPTGDKFTDFTLKEGESIRWYVIKQEVDNWHVDGIIINQKATYRIEYVDIDTMEELGSVERTIVDDFSGVQVVIIDGVPYVDERAIQFTDYQYHSAKNDKITLTAADLYVDGNNTITLYFKKNAPTVPYHVIYLCDGEEIAPRKVVNDRHVGEIVEEHAIDIEGYILDDLDTKTIELSEESNVIVFVYKVKINEVTPTPNPVTPTPDPVTPTPNPVTPTPDPVTPTPTIIPDDPTPTPTNEPDDPSPTPTDKPDDPTPTPTITVIPTVTPLPTITPMPTEKPELVIEDEDTPLGNADENSLDTNEMNELVIADERIPLGNGELPKTGTANEIVIYMLGIAFVTLGSTVVMIDKKKKRNEK